MDSTSRKVPSYFQSEIRNNESCEQIQYWSYVFKHNCCILLLYIKLVMVKLYIHLAILGNTLYLLSLFEPIVNLFTNWKDNFVPSCLKSIKVLDVPR